MTTPVRAMIENIFNLILTQLISSKMGRSYVSSIGIRTIIANGGLDLQCIKHIVHMPLARQLKTKGHGTGSSNNPKWTNKLCGKFT